jgi:hypothetical protein
LRVQRTVAGVRRWRGRVDWTDDAGFVGGTEALPFGILIFVIGALLIANAWAVVDAKFAVDAATREGVRAFVEAPDEHSADETARQHAVEVMRGYGRDPSLLEMDPPAYPSGSGFARCAEVTVRATYPVPAVSLPWIGGFGQAFRVSASHTEIIDPYRSGLSAGGGC